MQKLCCELCQNAKNQFVHDTRTDTMICTICGCVVSNFRFGELTGTHVFDVSSPGQRALYRRQKPASPCFGTAISNKFSSFTDSFSPMTTRNKSSQSVSAQPGTSSSSSKPQASRNPKSSPERNQHNVTAEASSNMDAVSARLLNKVFPENQQASILESRLRRFVDLTDTWCSESRVLAQCMALIKRFPKLYQGKSASDARLVATIIIVRDSCGMPTNTKAIESATGVMGVSKAVSKLCRVTNISQKSNAVKYIPYVRSQLGLSFDDEKKITRLFLRNTKINGSIGSYTVLALTLYYFMNKNSSRLDEIAGITCTSKISLHNYIDGRKVFQHSGE